MRARGEDGFITVGRRAIRPRSCDATAGSLHARRFRAIRCGDAATSSGHSLQPRRLGLGVRGVHRLRTQRRSRRVAGRLARWAKRATAEPTMLAAPRAAPMRVRVGRRRSVAVVVNPHAELAASAMKPRRLRAMTPVNAAAAKADPSADSATLRRDVGSAPASRVAAERFTTDARLVQPSNSPVLTAGIVSGPPRRWSLR